MTGKSNIGAHNAKVMNRFELTKRLVGQLKREEAVIGGIGNANFDLWASGQRPQNFYMLGSMGLTIPIALGVAIAQPQRHVIALEGDGSLLMQLGCLATVAERAPTRSPDRSRQRARHRPIWWRSRAAPELPKAPGPPMKMNSTSWLRRRSRAVRRP
jgi:hypothetical protein